MLTFTDPRTIDLRHIDYEDLVELSYDDLNSRRIADGPENQSDPTTDALWTFLMRRKLEIDSGYTNIARQKR